MTFHTENTLAGYARAAVTLRTRMADAWTGTAARNYLTELLSSARRASAGLDAADVTTVADTVANAIRPSWAAGEAFVLAPAMTAIIAAAAAALDLTGDLLTADAAPCDVGVLFLPEPIYHRHGDGHLSAVGAITWIPLTTRSGQSRSWVICAWAPVDNPEDPRAVGTAQLIAEHLWLRTGLGPYVLTEYALLPVAEPVPAKETRHDDAVTDWQSAPDGRQVIADDTANMNVVLAIAYAFWRIQAQPLAVAAKPPLDRATRRRAHRASIRHDTRVVMLRRTSPITDRGDGEPAWHYRVRFYVRGHWRRLVDKQGVPYRVWINGHIKGPDGAPLLHGEKVAVLAR